MRMRNWRGKKARCKFKTSVRKSNVHVSKLIHKPWSPKDIHADSRANSFKKKQHYDNSDRLKQTKECVDVVNLAIHDDADGNQKQSRAKSVRFRESEDEDGTECIFKTKCILGYKSPKHDHMHVCWKEFAK